MDYPQASYNLLLGVLALTVLNTVMTLLVVANLLRRNGSSGTLPPSEWELRIAEIVKEQIVPVNTKLDQVLKRFYP